MIFERPGEPPPLSRAVRAALYWGLVPFVGALRNLIVAREATATAIDEGARKEARFLNAIALIDVLAMAALALGMIAPAVRDIRAAPAERRIIGITTSQVEGGVRVDEIFEHGPAARAGLRAGDVIKAVDGGAITSLDELSGKLQPAGDHLLKIARGRGEATVQVAPERDSTVAQLAPLFRSTRSSVDLEPATALRQLSLVLLAPALLLGMLAVAFRRSISRLGAVGAFFAAQALAAAAGAAALVATSRRLGTGWGAFLVAQLGMDLALLAAGAFFWSRRDKLGIAAPGPASIAVGGWTPSELPAREWAKAGALCAVLLLPRVNAVGLYLSRLLHDWHFGESPLEHLTSMPAAGLVFVIVAAVLLAPAAEEVVFRGILHGWLRSFLPAPAAIGLGAAAFALVHLHYGARALGIFVIGCVLGWVRERSGTLRAPMAAHALNNAVATAFLVFRYVFH